MSKLITFILTVFAVTAPVFADVVISPEPEQDPTAPIKWIALGVGAVMLISLVCLKLYFPDNTAKLANAKKENV